MKVDRYECDVCHAPIENYREYRIEVTFPVESKVLTRVTRSQRRTKRIDLCENCMDDFFEKFMPEELGEEE